MASQINKYAQNIAKARYATPSYRAPQRRATIDPSLFSGKTAAKGAPLASRQVAASIQETGPEAMSITDGEASAQPQMVTETQQPIENRGDSARYMIQGGGPKIDLSFLVPERANKAYDPSKAIGGENVPYQESKGIGGFFRRLLGDESNRMNIEAQQAQGAEWKAEAASEKERLAGIETYRTQRGIDKELEDARDDKRNAQAITMFDKAQAAQKELLQLQQAFTKAQSAEERTAILDRIGKQHTNALDLQTRALAASEKNLGLQQAFQSRMANFNAQLDDYANKNKIAPLGNGFFSRGGEVYGLTPGSPGFGNMPGTDPSVTAPLTGPIGKGAQLPQMDVGGTAPTMGTQRGVTTQPRSSGGRLFDILEGNETPMEPEATPATTSPVAAVDQSTLGPTPAIPGASMPREEAPTNAPRFGPFLMEEFQKRAKTLAKDARSRPNAADPLMLPMFENIAKSLGIGSEGVGASRQVRRPASAVVERDLGSYLPKFGQLPQEEQNTAVLDALNKSMRQPRYRTFPNFEYNYNAQ